LREAWILQHALYSQFCELAVIMKQVEAGGDIPFNWPQVNRK